MMKITGNARKYFFLWLYQEYDFTRITFNELYPVNLKESLIIEWLDSVGIYIDIEFFRESLKGITFISGTTTKENGFEPTKEEFTDRQSAIKKAIEQAIEIYNNR